MNNMPTINITGLAVDIDETLSYTIGHLVSKLQENFGNPENLSVKEIIEKYRYTSNVPYWQHDEAKQWIDKEIHSNELQENLPLIEDANIYLNKINEIIPIAAYVTVRPEVVKDGTKVWLDKHDFPLAPIICRPMNVAHTDGNKWKAGILQELYPQIIGIIDDNAKLLEFLDKDYKGMVFLYDHHNSDSQLNVVPCTNWLKVFEEIKKNLNSIKMTKKFKIIPPTKIKIVETPGKGLGVVATADIKKGEIIETFPVVYLSKKDVKYLDDESDLLTFYPMYLETHRKDCIMFGYGSIYNHDRKNPNADIYYPKHRNDRYLMMKAIKKISKGEEIVYDYGFDDEEEFLDLK